MTSMNKNINKRALAVMLCAALACGLTLPGLAEENTQSSVPASEPAAVVTADFEAPSAPVEEDSQTAADELGEAEKAAALSDDETVSEDPEIRDENTPEADAMSESPDTVQPDEIAEASESEERAEEAPDEAAEETQPQETQPEEEPSEEVKESEEEPVEPTVSDIALTIGDEYVLGADDGGWSLLYGSDAVVLQLRDGYAAAAAQAPGYACVQHIADSRIDKLVYIQVEAPAEEEITEPAEDISEPAEEELAEPAGEAVTVPEDDEMTTDPVGNEEATPEAVEDVPQQTEPEEPAQQPEIAEPAEGEMTEELTEDEVTEELAGDEVTEEPAVECETAEPAEEKAENTGAVVETIPAVSEPAAHVHTGSIQADIRLEADGMSAVVSTVPADTEVVILEYVDSDWAKVSAAGVIGYVHRTQLEGASFPARDDEAGEINIRVTIFTDRSVSIEPGTVVTLTSLVEGADDYRVEYQWECDQGTGFAPVPGANDETWQFSASVETLSWSWCLVIDCYEK